MTHDVMRSATRTGRGSRGTLGIGIALAAFAVALVPRWASSQSVPVIRAGPKLTGEWALEQLTRERWMHGRQQRRFAPFLSDRHWLMVDSIRGGAVSRRLYLTLDRSAYGRDAAVIAVGASGHIVRLDVELAPFTRRGAGFPGDSAYLKDRQRRGSDEGVSLPASRLWDVVPTVPDAALRVGFAWTDTIAREADDGPFHQAMRGTRISTIAGERVVEGRHLWIVHDSARVAYDERYPEAERTLDTTVLVSRVATGTISGVHLYDPALHLSRERDDTTLLAGDAILRYPDGRTFHTPARFERTRHWALLDAHHYADRIAEIRYKYARGSGGMVFVPGNALEKRLADGEIKARDSLIMAWQRTTDPDQSAGLFQLLTMWVARDPSSAARLDSLRVSAGDTAYLYQLLARRAFRRDPVDSEDVRAMLPFMEDPSLAWSYNLSRDWLYENLVQALTTWPRAAADVSPPRGSVACTVSACRLLAGQWSTAHEPRLRDVGLIALLSLDPARWADTVLRLAGPAHPLLLGAVPLVHGVGATWPASSHASLPSETNDWHEWLEWMDGRSPHDLRSLAEGTLPAAFKRDTLANIRFEESHATAVRFFQARTGRDVVAEWRRAYDAARSDSARLVFGSMLEGIGALHLTASEVAEGFTSADAARITLARQALYGSTGWSRMDSLAAEPILQRLLAAIVDSVPLWPNATENLGPTRRGSLTILHARRGQIFLDPEGLTPGLRVVWTSRVQFITKKAWGARDVREAGLFYTISPLQSWGRFVRVELNASERNARSADSAPAVNASGVTYLLMSLGGSWVIVATDAWVT